MDPNLMINAPGPSSNHNYGWIIIISALILLNILGFGLWYVVSKNKQILPDFNTLSSSKPKLVSKIDRANKKGEFVIEDAKPSAPNNQSSKQQQVILSGEYDKLSDQVTAQTSVQESDILLPHVSNLNPPGDTPYWIKAALESGSKTEWINIIPLYSEDKQQTISFQIQLPYKNNSVIKIYNRKDQLLWSESIK